MNHNDRNNLEKSRIYHVDWHRILKYNQMIRFVCIPGTQSIQGRSLHWNSSLGLVLGLHLSSSGQRTSRVFMPCPHVTEHTDQDVSTQSIHRSWFNPIYLFNSIRNQTKRFLTRETKQQTQMKSNWSKDEKNVTRNQEGIIPWLKMYHN